MKKMLLIGGIISTVLPAMATDLDLSAYHLVDGVGDTCTGPEGYNGFTSGSVNMTPLYIQECSAGSYLNVTNQTSVQTHQTNEVTDYLYVDACSTCPDNYYCEGVLNPAPDVNGVLSSDGATSCPGSHPLSDGGATSINACYQSCSETITSEMMASMKASSVEYTNNGKAYYNNACTMHINTCADGYELLDLATGGTFTIESSAWTLTKSGRSYEGTFGCADNVCSASLTGSNITVPSSASYVDNAACLAGCGSENDWQANIAAAIADVANNNYLTDGTSFCAAKIVNINWAGVAEPGDAATCTYDGALTAPDAPVVSGYEFVGWTVGEVTNNNND